MIMIQPRLFLTLGACFCASRLHLTVSPFTSIVSDYESSRSWISLCVRSFLKPGLADTVVVTDGGMLASAGISSYFSWPTTPSKTVLISVFFPGASRC